MEGARDITIEIFKRKIWNLREEEKKVSLNDLIHYHYRLIYEYSFFFIKYRWEDM